MQGARGGWFIPAKPTANGGLTAFVEPFLDVNKITEDTKELLKAMVPRTTDDWEVFMSICHKEHFCHVLVLTCSRCDKHTTPTRIENTHNSHNE
jgi:hypothetical protein